MFGSYFSGTESAYTAMNKIKIKSKADDGNRRAKNTLFISNNFDRALSTILIGNNVARTAAASVATVIAAREFSHITNYGLWTTVLTTLIFFFFAEMIPKAFANDRSDTTALFFSGSLKTLMKILGPFAAFFTWISGFFTRLFAGEQQPSITEDELIDIIDTAEEEGVVDEERSEMLRSVISFSNTPVVDVMTMADDIQAVDVHASPEEILAFIREVRHSRIPVYDGDLDRIVGILKVRTFLQAYFHDRNVDIRPLLKEPYFANESDLVDDLFDVMKGSQHYIAVIRSDSGKTLGVATIEDFLEELVGEIWDEDDVVDESFLKLGGNRFSVDPACALDDVLRRIGLAEVPQDSRTLGTWALERFGHLPEEEEAFSLPMNDGMLTVTAEEVSETHIVRLILKLDEEKAGGEPA
ncbi:MAG: HlyC/CorC family transporter [Clostridia bacterium]|nr:HlyC/CorC family transporter [Clostridia bacterium]